ncbi:hypothetical protein Tco_0719456, partial [Tanacetum coccineum]
YSLLLTPMCCDDAYLVTPRIFALAGCDRLVSEPLVIENYLGVLFSCLSLSFISTEKGRVVKESKKEVDSDLLLDARSRPGPAELGGRVRCGDVCNPDKDGCMKYLADANLHVHVEEIKVDKTLHFVEEPVEIIDREVKSLKRSRVSIVKVHWNSKRGHEDFMKTKYPHLLVE